MYYNNFILLVNIMTQRQETQKQLAALLETEIEDVDNAEKLAAILLGDAIPDPPSSSNVYSEWDRDALQVLAETGTVSSGGIIQYLETPETRDSTRKLSTASMRVLLLSDINGEQWAQDLSMLDETEKYGWLWLDVTDPTQCEVEQLGQRFGLHPLTVEDIVDDATSQDKMERIGGYALVMYRTTTDMTAETAFSIVVGSGWILSFHTSAAQMHVDRVLDRLQEHSNELLGSSFVVYALIDEITDWLTMTMTQIEHDVVQIDNAVMTQVPEEHTGMLQHMGLLRRRIVGIQRLQLGKPDVVRRVARVLGSNDELGHHFRDVCDHLAALGSLCTQCEVVLSRAHSNFMAQMSLKMNQTTHGLGMFSNRWLVLLGLMLPLQLVAMAFGQNVYVPWMYSDQPLRFDTIAPWLGIMGCILLAFTVGLGFAWYRNYLSR